jgi:hypothetical protein
LPDIEAARANLRDDENSAPVAEAAYQALPKDWPSPDLMRRLDDLAPEARLEDADAVALRDELAKVQTAVAEGSKLVERPNGRHPIAYAPVFHNTRDGLVQHTRGVVYLLRLDSILQAQDQDLNGALRSCRAQLNAARSVGDDPRWVSLLVRLAGVGMTVHGTQRVLAQGEPDADELLRMQRALEAEERFPRLLVALRGERAGMHEELQGLEAGEITLAEFAETAEAKKRQGLGFIDRDYVRSHHAEILALHTEAVRIAALQDHERAQPLAAFESRVSGTRLGVLSFALPTLVSVLDRSARRADGQLRCLIAALAVERYRRQHGRWPDGLQQLVPEFLAAVPLDPQDGEPLGFQRLTDRVVIYSRLAVRSGEYGDVAYDPDEPSRPGAGLAIRLFDVPHRRQPPRQKPPPLRDDDDPQ